MRRFLLGICFVALFAGVVSAGVGARERPTGGIIATPSKVEFGTIANDGGKALNVEIKNGTRQPISIGPLVELAAPFSFADTESCSNWIAPGHYCYLPVRALGTTVGTFKTSIQQPFVWLDPNGAEHSMYVALRFSVTVSANHAPTTPLPLSVTTPLDVPLTITVTGYDADGDSLTFDLWMKNVSGGSLALPFVNTQCDTDPETGASTCTAQTTYTPSGDYVGQDSFGFRVNDGEFEAYGGVNIMVTGEIDP